MKREEPKKRGKKPQQPPVDAERPDGEVDDSDLEQVSGGAANVYVENYRKVTSVN